MNDPIDRQTAIDAHYEYCNKHPDAGFPVWSLKILENLPSAQPETHEERTETHACDCISRQSAIDAILAVTGNSSVRELYEHVQEHGLSDMWSGGVNAAIDIIIAVPSAQPEIIHCGECKHRDPEDHKCDCGHDIIWQLPRDDKWYCAYAERRTDG